MDIEKISDVAIEDARYLKLDQTTPQTITASPVLDWLTASQAVMTDANKKLISADYLNQAVKTTSSPTFANITDSGLTSGRVPYATTGGLLTDNSGFTFSPTASNGLYITRTISDIDSYNVYSALSQLATTAGAKDAHAMRFLLSSTVTADATIYGIGVFGDLGSVNISSGVTDSGYRVGLYSEGYINNASNQGTLAAAYGTRISSGIATTGAGGKINTAYGHYVRMFNDSANGTIDNAYGLYIDTFGTTGTYTNQRYAIYQAGADDPNYFAGNIINAKLTSGRVTYATTGGQLTDSSNLTFDGTKLGIGTASPLVQVHIKGTTNNPVYISTDATAANHFVLEDTSVADASTPFGYFRTRGGVFTMGNANRNPATGLTTGSVDRFSIAANGNVGIGTTSPNTPLHISDPDDANYIPLTLSSGVIGVDTNTIEMRWGYTGNTYQKGAIIYEGKDAYGRGKFHFALDAGANSVNANLADSKMTIQYDGNVGIGTTAPAGIFHVADTGGTSYFQVARGDNGGASVEFRKSRSTLASPSNVQNGDDLGGFGAIGYSNGWTTAGGQFKFFVDGTFTAGDRPPTAMGIYTNKAGQASLERLRVDDEGNVGIGTTAPDRACEINSATGINLRLTYNDSNGSASAYADLLTDATGNLILNTVGSVCGDPFSDQRTYEEAGIFLDLSIDCILLLGWLTPSDNGTEVDLSGKGHTATYTDASDWTASDQLHKGFVWTLDFDATNDLITVTDADDLSFGNGTNDEAVTFFGWIQVVNTAATQDVMAKWNGTNNEYVILLGTDEKLKLFLADDSAGAYPNRATDAGLSAGWHFFAVTYDGAGGATAMNNVKIYVDGLVVASTATNAAAYVAMENKGVAFSVGDRVTGTNWFQGDMGMIGVDNSEWTAAKVWRAYIATRGYYNL